MRKSIGVILLVLAGAAVLSTASLIHTHEVRNEGFFSLYQGENYVDRGYPWGFWRCYDGGQCGIITSRLLIDVAFWAVIMAALIATVRLVVRRL